MTLDEILSGTDPSRMSELSPKELERLFWKHKGLRKQSERDTSFWQATNDNLKLAYEKLDEQERLLSRAYQIIREDLQVAQQVQSALLPVPFKEMQDELDIAIYHKQLTEVGGDYYDFFRLPNQRYAIGVLDISGHGVSAALIMAFLKAQFMQIMKQQASPKGIVEWVNETSFSFLKDVRRYATVNLVAFEATAIHYVSGGGYGFLVHGSEQQSFAKGNSFLGLRLKPYQEHALPFHPGDILALYTDGIPEAQSHSGTDYSVHRLNRLVGDHRDKTAQEILDACVDDYRRFRKEDSDDITLLIAKRR